MKSRKRRTNFNDTTDYISFNTRVFIYSNNPNKQMKKKYLLDMETTTLQKIVTKKSLYIYRFYPDSYCVNEISKAAHEFNATIILYLLQHTGVHLIFCRIENMRASPETKASLVFLHTHVFPKFLSVQSVTLRHRHQKWSYFIERN